MQLWLLGSPHKKKNNLIPISVNVQEDQYE